MSKHLSIFRALCALLGALLVTGFGASPAFAQDQASGGTSTPASIADTASSAYVLGRDDVIQVGLLGRTDFGGRARVEADGTIELPFIGKVQAANQTTSQLADVIRKKLKDGGYFADPVVTIEVVGYASRYVTVLGNVGSPGLVPINRPYHLSEILARVGGVRDGSADYVIVRSPDGTEKHYNIRELATGSGDQDPYVAAGDKIFSPSADTFYIYGQVHNPGAFPVQSKMTLRMAIAKAGGLTDSGSDKKVTVTRGGKKVKLSLGDPIQPNDVVVIGERLF